MERNALRDHVVTLKMVQSHIEGWKNESRTEMEAIRMRMEKYLRKQQGERAHLLLQRMTLWQFYGLAFKKMDPVAWERTGPLASSKSSRSNDQACDDLQQMAHEAASSLATKTRAQGQAVIELLGHRASSSTTLQSSSTPVSLVGHITAASRFEATHDRILERLRLVLQRIVHDEEKTDSYGDDFQLTLSRLAVVSMGWNTLSVAYGIMGYADLQGIILASASVAAGTALLFTGRTHAAQQYAQVWQSKAEQLDHDLRTVWEEELERLESQIVQGISPFQRFVHAEEVRLDELQTEAERILSSSQKLRYQVSQQQQS